MIRLFRYFHKRDWLFIIIAIGFIVLQVWLDLKIPEFMAEVTRLVQTPGSPLRDIWINGGFMLLCAFGSLATAIIIGYLIAIVASSFGSNLRFKLFDKVESYSMAEINQFSTASLITRSTNDVTQVQMFIVMGIQLLIKSPIMAFWALAKISGKSWQWSALTGSAVVMLLTVVMIIMIFAIPRFRKIQVLTDNLNRVTRENLTGIRVVRAYNAEPFEQAKFEKANAEVTSNNLFVQRIMSIMNPTMSFVMSGMSLGIYWIGAYIINQANMMSRIGLFSDMVVFMSYAVQVVFSFMMLTFIFIMLPRATVSAKRINEVLNTHSTIHDGSYQGGTTLKGEVEFRNVSFKYPGAEAYVIKDVSFKAKPGETVAFIGSTGSGKSTIVNLIPRFYDATEGEILINGINVKDYKLHDLHDLIGYVPQKAVMFTGTIQENVAYGSEEATLEKVKVAVQIAQAKDFVDSLDKGFDYQVARGGTNLSGGQKQRLAIARAVCKDPEIFIFDDSFSALDYKTDKLLRSELKKQTQAKTNLIVASRIGTILDADKIIVLEQGKVVGVGTHRELLNNCQVYQEIAYSQLSKEELAHEQ